MGKKKIFILAMLRNMVNLGWTSLDLKIPCTEYHRMANIGSISWSLPIGRKEVQRGGRIWLKLQVIQNMIVLMLSLGPNFKALFTANMRNLRRKGPVCSCWCYLQNVTENSDWCVQCLSHCYTHLAMMSCLLQAQKWRDWDILQWNFQKQ